MKTLDQWLAEYSASHRSAKNKITHWLGIPLIVFAVFAGLKAVPLASEWLNATTAAMVLALVYYTLLSWRLALGMAAVFAVIYALILPLEQASGRWLPAVAMAVFAAGWVLQFIGHAYEGMKPSFFKDMQFLMIGPLWLLADVYRRMQWPMLPAARQA